MRTNLGNWMSLNMKKRIFPLSIPNKSVAGRYRPVRVADGPITARWRFINNASWVLTDAPNKVSDKPVQSARSDLIMIVVRMTKIRIIDCPKCAQWKFWSHECPKVRFLTLQFECLYNSETLHHIPSTLVILTSLISNNRLSRRENLVPV